MHEARYISHAFVCSGVVPCCVGAVWTRYGCGVQQEGDGVLIAWWVGLGWWWWGRCEDWWRIGIELGWSVEWSWWCCCWLVVVCRVGVLS